MTEFKNISPTYGTVQIISLEDDASYMITYVELKAGYRILLYKLAEMRFYAFLSKERVLGN